MLDIFHVTKYFGNALLHVTLGTGSFIMSQGLRSGLNNEKPRCGFLWSNYRKYEAFTFLGAVSSTDYVILMSSTYESYASD